MTKIFKDYLEFCNREDKKENGVSQAFIDSNPEWEKMNETNKACWNCSDCSHCSDCSDCSDCSGCSGCSRCSHCSGCSRCSHCSDCSGCSRCSHCSDCSDCSRCSRCSRCSHCSDCSGLENASPVKNAFPEIPAIENIHQKVYEAASGPHALNMNKWHTCNTTHCRAGWVAHLAGDAGKELEARTSTLFAAMQIYHKSSPIAVSPVRFYEGDKVALEDMKRCADEEKALQNN